MAAFAPGFDPTSRLASAFSFPEAWFEVVLRHSPAYGFGFFTQIGAKKKQINILLSCLLLREVTWQHSENKNKQNVLFEADLPSLLQQTTACLKRRWGVAHCDILTPDTFLYKQDKKYSSCLLFSYFQPQSFFVCLFVSTFLPVIVILKKQEKKQDVDCI